MKKNLAAFAAAALIISVYIFTYKYQDIGRTDSPKSFSAEGIQDNRNEKVWVEGEGEVVKILPDDNKGSRHQRFIIKLENGKTLLIAHNIDIAPKIEKLKIGDIVEFSGEFVWNEKGGIIHWTHHDPDKETYGGWLRHEGTVYK
ncbi:MAG: DUF3465 domain-containing protein [Hydrogenimonas sp.]|nr:DUF3465 domain-containing protein [Hydrogenimonas sp.]